MHLESEREVFLYDRILLLNLSVEQRDGGEQRGHCLLFLRLVPTLRLNGVGVLGTCRGSGVGGAGQRVCVHIRWGRGGVEKGRQGGREAGRERW